MRIVEQQLEEEERSAIEIDTLECFIFFCDVVVGFAFFSLIRFR